MSKPTSLTDLQLVLMTTAAQRADGSAWPPSPSIADQNERIAKAIPPLLRRKLLKESDTRALDASWRNDGDQRIGLTITDAGRAAIGAVDETDTAPAEGDPGAVSTTACPLPADTAAQPRATKAMQILDLLRREDGATLDELIDATGWLPHTTRAALTGLRKKGHAVDRFKRDESTCYRVAPAA